MATWRADGIGIDKLEIWVVGEAGSDQHATPFADGTDVSCFADQTAWDAYSATKDDVFLIAKDGTISRKINLATLNLTTQSNREQFDGWVRDLVK